MIAIVLALLFALVPQDGGEVPNQQPRSSIGHPSGIAVPVKTSGSPTEILAHATANDCTPAIWSHVYKPHRLKLFARCVAVTGTITDASKGKRKDGVRMEKDGDIHGWLRLDPEFAPLLDEGNMTHEGSNLVFEVVCYHTVSQADAISACKGYANPVLLFPVGTRVRMVGSYIEDDNHAHWRELHPVSRIERLPIGHDVSGYAGGDRYDY